MKAIAYLVGIILIFIAVVYFMMPADQLPNFMPGHQAGLMRVHYKHGVLAGAFGVALLIIGWFMGRRR